MISLKTTRNYVYSTIYDSILVLQLLVILTSTWCAEHSNSVLGSGPSFLAIQNNEDSEGVEITILSNVLEKQQSQIHIDIPGHSLSPGCGDHYF